MINHVNKQGLITAEEIESLLAPIDDKLANGYKILSSTQQSDYYFFHRSIKWEGAKFYTSQIKKLTDILNNMVAPEKKTRKYKIKETLPIENKEDPMREQVAKIISEIESLLSTRTFKENSHRSYCRKYKNYLKDQDYEFTQNNIDCLLEIRGAMVLRKYVNHSFGVEKVKAVEVAAPTPVMEVKTPVLEVKIEDDIKSVEDFLQHSTPINPTQKQRDKELSEVGIKQEYPCDNNLPKYNYSFHTFTSGTKYESISIQMVIGGFVLTAGNDIYVATHDTLGKVVEDISHDLIVMTADKGQS